jgi:hypothetical protein
MCPIRKALKSMKEVNQLPASVELGIDRSIDVDIENGQSQIEVIENNLDNNVKSGGQAVLTKVRKVRALPVVLLTLA